MGTILARKGMCLPMVAFLDGFGLSVTSPNRAFLVDAGKLFWEGWLGVGASCRVLFGVYERTYYCTYRVPLVPSMSVLYFCGWSDYRGRKISGCCHLLWSVRPSFSNQHIPNDLFHTVKKWLTISKKSIPSL